MTLKAILLFSIVATSTLCNGQVTAQVTNSTLIDQNSAIDVGDTVSDIDKSIWSIFQDKKQNYWFGSNGQGVYRFDGHTIMHFTMKDGLCYNQIRKIQDDTSGNIYFTTERGISKFDGHTFTTLSTSASSSSITEWKLEPEDLWFTGAQDAGVVYRYDGKSLYCLKFPKTRLGDEFESKYPRSKYPNMTYSPYDVYSIFKDSKGNLWFGTSSLGVCRFDGRSFSWISDLNLAESPVRSICEDENGNFWFGNSAEAVFCYDGKQLTDYRKEKGIGNLRDVQKDAPVSYMSIIEDNNGELWISTYQTGVWRYDGKQTTHYPIKDGNTITSFSMYKDKQGDLWLGTNEEGVYRFNGMTFESVGLLRQ